MELARQLLSISGVILLAAAAAWWLRRRGLGVSARRGRQLEALERLPLSPHHWLVLVRIRERALVIGLSPSGCTVLETLEWRDAEVRCAD